MACISSYFNTSTPMVPGDFLVYSVEGAPQTALSSSCTGPPCSAYHFAHMSELALPYLDYLHYPHYHIICGVGSRGLHALLTCLELIAQLGLLAWCLCSGPSLQH